MSTSASATAPAPAGGNGNDEATELSAQYDTPLGLAHTTMQALKDRIKLHYDLASDYYLNLWGEHIHHGYWPPSDPPCADSKEKAQLNLIDLLLSTAALPQEPAAGRLRVLDVGCGVGGTSRHVCIPFFFFFLSHPPFLAMRGVLP